jgi:hypothetical protein
MTFLEANQFHTLGKRAFSFTDTMLVEGTASFDFSDFIKFFLWLWERILDSIFILINNGWGCYKELSRLYRCIILNLW